MTLDMRHLNALSLPTQAEECIIEAANGSCAMMCTMCSRHLLGALLNVCCCSVSTLVTHLPHEVISQQLVQ